LNHERVWLVSNEGQRDEGKSDHAAICTRSGMPARHLHLMYCTKVRTKYGLRQGGSIDVLLLPVGLQGERKTQDERSEGGLFAPCLTVAFLSSRPPGSRWARTEADKGTNRGCDTHAHTEAWRIIFFSPRDEQREDKGGADIPRFETREHIPIPNPHGVVLPGGSPQYTHPHTSAKV
jgi:hypothetical protein